VAHDYLLHHIRPRCCLKLLLSPKYAMEGKTKLIFHGRGSSLALRTCLVLVLDLSLLLQELLLANARLAKEGRAPAAKITWAKVCLALSS
jgi:hypothetical protein